MQLKGIKPDDIVRVDDGGGPWLGFVLRKERGRIQARHVGKPLMVRTFTARRVVGHWAKRA